MGVYCVRTSPSCSTWICSFDSRVSTESLGNSTLATMQFSRLADWQPIVDKQCLREAFDKTVLVLDGSALVLCLLLGAE